MKAKKIFNHLILAGSFLTMALAGCQAATPSPVSGQVQQLSVMTHDSFAVSEPVIREFEIRYNAKVTILPSGDTGQALNKAILSKNSPLADVFYGVDNTFLGRALAEGIFETYASPALDNVPAEFQLDPQQRALPIDYGDVCLNYDLAYFEEKQIPPPASLDDLLKPEYKDLAVVQNPASSSPGLAFLLATIGKYGEAGYLDYWKSLRANGVLVVNDWSTAYYTEFTRAGGNRPIVLSYSSSPVFEILFAEPPAEGEPTPAVVQPPTAALTGDGACYRQVEFAGILKGTQNRPLAEKWIDFMLSKTFQEDLPLQMYVFPVNRQADLGEAFDQYLINPTNPISLPAAQIAERREQWIQAWTEAVLR